MFCEIDSVFPEKPEYEFLRSKKFRIKTMKMAGVLSQGICFPMSVLTEGNYEIGDDVTEQMGITQYEATMDVEKIPEKTKYPKFLMKQKWFRDFIKTKEELREFPSFISKTDEVRIQNVPHYLDLDFEYVATEKVDGQSGTFTLQRVKRKFPGLGTRYDFAVCSRNYRINKRDNSAYWCVEEKYKIKNVLRSLIGKHEWVALHGECVGVKVQGNKYNVKEPDMYVFNLIYPTGRVASLEAKKIIENNGLKFVPIIEENVKLNGKSVADVLEYATGKSQLYDTLREGVVFRSTDGKHSFKAVSPDFLMKHNE